MAKKDYVRKGGASFPALHTTRSFAAYIGKSERWVRSACQDGVIMACQQIGGSWWIIAEDTLLRPRALKGMDGELLDLGLPKEKIIGHTYVVKPPEYKKKVGNPEGNPQRKVTVKGWPRIKRELGVGRDKIYHMTGVHPFTQKKMENYEPVISDVVWKLAHVLDMEVEDLLRE